MSAPSEVVAPRRRGWTLFRRLLPFVSFGVGVAGALLMDRGPRRAAAVAAFGVAGWVLLVVAIVVRGRQERETVPHRSSRAVGLLRFSTLALTQSGIQTSLFFALPFYLKSSSGEPAHLAFIGILGLAGALSLWDPLTTRWLLQGPAPATLPALGSFAGLAVVLPGFGASNIESLWVSALASSLGVVAVSAARVPAGRSRLRELGIALAVALVIPLALGLGAARVVPAVPLRLADIALGTRQEGRGVADRLTKHIGRPWRLVCATSIWAPLRVQDELLHVWRHDGVVVDVIALEVAGGRREGFRTWSVKKNFPDDATGTWTCTVETRSGQRLGETSVEVTALHGGS